MMAAKAFLGVWGVVSVGASECTNATLHAALSPPESQDVAVDSDGYVWFTNAEGGEVWRCHKDGECTSIMGDWDWPVGIAAYNSGPATILYVSEEREQKVKKCMLNPYAVEKFWCKEFGSGWVSPQGLALDRAYVYITDADGDHLGVWKCSHFVNFDGNCTLVGDSDGWPRQFPPANVAVDSQGTVYVTRGYAALHDPICLRVCNAAGGCSYANCSDFHWPEVGPYHTAVAVDRDDNMYISASGGRNPLMRCRSYQDVCHEVGSFYGGVNMVIDYNGAFFVVDGDGDLRRECLSPAINDIQV